MADFDIHSIESAPEASRPFLEDSKRAVGRVPGLHGVMAEAPALLDGYKHLHRLFAEETSFDKDRQGIRKFDFNPSTQIESRGFS